MGFEQLAVISTLALACFGAIGGTVRWAHREFKEQSAKLDKLEKENLKLLQLYGQVRVRLDRVRLAFDMVAGALRQRDPKNDALAAAERILREAFPVEPVPHDFDELLHEIGGE